MPSWNTTLACHPSFIPKPYLHLHRNSNNGDSGGTMSVATAWGSDSHLAFLALALLNTYYKKIHSFPHTQDQSMSSSPSDPSPGPTHSLIKRFFRDALQHYFTNTLFQQSTLVQFSFNWTFRMEEHHLTSGTISL